MSIAKEELAYVLINPYTVFKSRTGGVISRLFTRTALELVAARMFAPSRELVEKYAEIIVSTKDPQDRKIQELIRQYILDNYSPDPKTGQRRRPISSGALPGSVETTSRTFGGVSSGSASYNIPSWQQGINMSTNNGSTTKRNCPDVAMVADFGAAPPGELRVDGGMIRNNLLMQFQADILGRPVVRPPIAEISALGAAYAAGLAVGFWSGLDELRSMDRVGGRWEPAMDEATRAAGIARWHKGVERTLGWVEPGA